MKQILFNSSGRLRSGWRLLLFILSLAIIGGLIATSAQLLNLPHQMVKGIVQPIPLFVTGIIIMGVALGLLWIFFRFIEKRPLATLGLPFYGPWLKGLGTGFLIGAAPVFLFIFVLLLFGYAQVRLNSITSMDIIQNSIPLIIGLALISAWEELAFRGYGLQLLTEGLGQWAGALITGLLFGLAHASNPGADVFGLVNIAISGVLLAWLVMLSGSLWISIGYHIGWNLISAMLFGLSNSGMKHPYPLLETDLSGPTWLTGGSFGFEASILLSLSEVVILGCAVAMVKHLPGYPEMRRYFNIDSDISGNLL